jgi:radical SAM protein with 4Fe4S-binding SPASM domain
MPRQPRFTQDGIRHATIGGHRFHLRLKDPTDDNFLWIDGRSPPLILDPVAADFMAFTIEALWKFQQGEGDESGRVRRHVVDAMYRKYGRWLAVGKHRVTKRRIAADLDRVFGLVMAAARGGCPVEANLAGRELNVARWAAPARMDLAITYRCNLNCPHCYIGGPTPGPELSTADWLRVLDRVWQIGVPQVVFTGGEPTLRDDLPDLVRGAEEFVTGLVTNGTRLEELAEPLRDASLDYVQVTLESASAEIHNAMVGDASASAHARTVAGIRKAVGLGMQVITNTTLTRENAAGFPALLAFAKELGVRSLSCNTLICSGRGPAAKRESGLSDAELTAALEAGLRAAADLGVSLQWYSPTCYLHLNPLELGFGAKGCSAAAHNMTVQPDGTVLPCQSWPQAVGHILNDEWAAIWDHPVSRKLREHGFAQDREECRVCVHNSACGGGCPLEFGVGKAREGEGGA